MPLKLESLRKSIEALERSTNAAAANMDTLSEDLRETVRAGVIQPFEVAYEQCWKFIQRWLRENRISEDADHPRTRKELFRMAARHGLIADPTPWFEYGEVRNETTHTYDEEQAAAAYETAKKFIVDARDLFARLDSKND
ncbi:MAG: nucleotidyltransferase substrate binding protein [Deltaproteobacteria bacterium]|nr:nucleotidyltransferase substrate binding protein [Deltaproteobacteria bacterium]